jgi:hypothetical protein
MALAISAAVGRCKSYCQGASVGRPSLVDISAVCSLQISQNSPMTRPVSVTVVAWVIIAISLEGLVSMVGGFITPLFATGTFHSPYSLNTTMWLGAGTLVVHIVLAALMLRGIGWARVVFICLKTLGLLGIILGRQPAALWISTGAQLIIFSVYLFRRESKEYFSMSAAKPA